jgi:hypothetical protein
VESYNLSGNITQSSVAVGPGAHSGPAISGVAGTSAEASRLLDELIATLIPYCGESQDVRDIQELAVSAKSELTAERPNKTRIDSLLRVMKKLLSNAGSAILRAGDLAGAIDNIRGLIGHL